MNQRGRKINVELSTGVLLLFERRSAGRRGGLATKEQAKAHKTKALSSF